MKQILKKLVSGVLVVSLLAGIAIVSTAAPATPEETSNLIKASNFYAGNDAWQISPNCTVDGVAYWQSYVDEVVPTMGKTRVLQITQKVGDTQTLPANLRQLVTLQKGKTYKLSYWLKIEGEGSSLEAYYNPAGAGANRTHVVSGITTTNGEWKKFEHTFNVEYDVVAAESRLDFQMTDTSVEDVVFKLTDVRLEETTTNYVPSVPSTRWSAYYPSVVSVTRANHAIKVIVPATATGNSQLTFQHDLEAGVTYILSFYLEIQGEVTNTTKAAGRNFSIHELSGSPNNFTGYDSTDGKIYVEKEWKVNSYSSTPQIRMYFARPTLVGTTTEYTVTDLKITKKEDIVEDAEEIKELVTTQPEAVTTDSKSASGNLYLNGDFRLKDDKTGTITSSAEFLNSGMVWPNPNALSSMKWEVVEDSGRDSVLKISYTNSTSAMILRQAVAWTPGKTYVGSYWRKQEGTANNFNLMIRDKAGSAVNARITPKKVGNGATTEWTQYTFEYTAGETDNYFDLQIGLNSQAITYLDDFVIEEKLPDAGEVSVAHEGDVEGSYTISFDLDITGEGTTYTNWGDEGLFSETSRGVLCQKGFEGENVLATFDATDGNAFRYTYTPTGVDSDAEEKQFILYLAPTTENTLTYSFENFSVTFRAEKAVQEIALNGADFTSDEPGAETSTSWGTNEDDAPYALIQRWERVNSGTFATTNTNINTALGEKGTFTEFASGVTYRYSLVVTPKEGYYLADDVALKLDGEIDADAINYYNDVDGSMIIYPTNSEVFFTVMGDATKDGSADVRDIVRMKRKFESPEDETIEVYLKKCKFETTTPDSILDVDIAEMRELLVK